MSDGFKRWRIGPFANGASGDSGGHWNILGLHRNWLPHPPYQQYEWSLFGLVAVRWTTDRGWDLAFAKIELHFKNARRRYTAREDARRQRETRKRFAKALTAARPEHL